MVEPYSPSIYAKLANSIPRLGTSGVSTEGKFEVSMDYAMSNMGFPILLLVLGLLSIIIFQFTLLCRCICRAWKCCQVDKSGPALFKNLIAFVVFIIIAIIADHMQYFGNNMLTVGVKNVISGINGMNTWFVGVGIITNKLFDSASGLVHLSSNSSVCSMIGGSEKDLFSGINMAGLAMTTAAGGLNDIVVDVPSRLDTATDFLKAYAISRKDLVMYIFYGFILANLLLFVIAGLMRSKIFTQIMIFFAELIIFALTIICCIEMVIVILFGDFCMQPADNLVNALGGLNSSVATIVNYYGNCPPGASSFIQDNKNAISLQLSQVNESLTNLTIEFSNFGGGAQDCKASLDGMIGNITLMDNAITSMGEIIKCETLNPIWAAVVNTGFCDNLFGGFFILWVCQFVTSGMIFIVMCIASVMFLQYEGPKIDPEQETQYAVAVDEEENYQQKQKGDIEMMGSGNYGKYEPPAAGQYHQLEAGGHPSEPSLD